MNVTAHNYDLFEVKERIVWNIRIWGERVYESSHNLQICDSSSFPFFSEKRKRERFFHYIESEKLYFACKSKALKKTTICTWIQSLDVVCDKHALFSLIFTRSTNGYNFTPVAKHIILLLI